jgi:thymidylate synthase ThyX
MKLKVIDNLSPEDVAMLQALYSRSAESVDVHLAKVRASDSGKFMERFYVGYGHKSIADCGSTTIFIEDVSILAAKAIQDWPLYSGQETSTRYVEMATRAIVDPVGSTQSKAILDRWMNFYVSNQDRVAAHVRAKHPKRADEKEDVYERAVKARTFDILRAFLPAGITTQLSWHTNLRQAGDHLVLLAKHPSAEIRDLAVSLRGLLGEQYPSSGLGLSLASVSGVGNSTGAQEREAWESGLASEYTYPFVNARVFRSSVDQEELGAYTATLKSRPRGSVLPHFLSDLGQIKYGSTIDFGSFRDIQRHRNGVCRMPLLTTEYGFEPWYTSQLDEALIREAEALIAEQTAAINAASEDPVVRQYYTALGFIVPCQVTYGLPAAIYVMELRSGKTVHPTLRRFIAGMIRQFEAEFPYVKLHVDKDPDDWDVRRGTQTIVARELHAP